MKTAHRSWTFGIAGLWIPMALAGVWTATALAIAADVPVAEVEGQPLGANVRRVMDALDFLGAPLPESDQPARQQAIAARDALALQRLLDPQALFVVTINPEARVKVERGPAPARLQQHGHTPVLVKVFNAAATTQRLRINSPQAGASYAGTAKLSMERQQQLPLLADDVPERFSDRFLHVDLFREPPMTGALSGLGVEYVVALIASSESGRREATIGFDLGQQNQDLGFRGEVPVLFDVAPARPLTLRIADVDGTPSMARLTIRDAAGRVYPPQARRVAPDFFFQPHVYRADGELVWLPVGMYRVESSRGPEYLVERQQRSVTADGPFEWTIKLKRWVNPASAGFYSGDHHIHGAGCAHYTRPTEGVAPVDMFRQVKGEGLNVGCVLTWGPCFDFQRKYFSATVDALSEPSTILKYDLEISGFGSQALGHVCLLNLRDQEYPGSAGSSKTGWPTWTTPVMRWAKDQGGVTGYAHSASGLTIRSETEAPRLLKSRDRNADGRLDQGEAESGVLPEPFARIDADRNGALDVAELTAALERAAMELPNFAIPEMSGVGAMEIAVATSEGVCDFISAMDTERIPEWNTWYHLLNCGFPLRVSGETDFPCMSSLQVGQGRVYVQLGAVERVDFGAWCRGLADGRSYVSDGYAHALRFTVNGVSPGPEPVALSKPGSATASARVAFAPETPVAVSYGTQPSVEGRTVTGDTRVLHGERSWKWIAGGDRRVELVVNGRAVAEQTVPADGQPHDLTWTISLDRSSWVTLRQFPQLHTNPVTVLIGEQPVRASRRSAQWCVEMIDVLWNNRERMIAPAERDAAKAAFERSKARYRQIAMECPPE